MRRVLVGLLVSLLAATLAPDAAHAAAVSPVPGGLPGNAKLAEVDTGGVVTTADQEPGNCSSPDVHCKPDLAGTCTGYTSQVTAPDTIRVLTGVSNPTITVVNFRDYVADSLYQEWITSWDGDAVKAGAVAVKSFAWYWITHRYGGYVGDVANKSTCFDISDDPNFFQKYKPGVGSKDARTVKIVADSWPVVMRNQGEVVEAQYRRNFYEPAANEPCGYQAGGTPDSIMSQYGTQACNEYSSRYKYNVILHLYYGNKLDLNTIRQQQTVHDFTYTATSTAATFTTAGNWSLADRYPTQFHFGTAGDVPLAPTNGDGFATAAVWRPSTHTFYVTDPLGRLTRTVPVGATGDLPVPAHYEGVTAPTQLAVFRPSNGTWYFTDAKGAVSKTVVFGGSGDIPVPGRWASATVSTISVFRRANGTWYRPNVAPIAFGRNGDIPAPADYNGDGRIEIAVYRPSTHTFYVRGGATVTYGTAGDVPVSGDFNGDGKADFAVYRPSTKTYYVRGVAAFALPAAGYPIGAAPYRD